jgi:hypothetical protein
MTTVFCSPILVAAFVGILVLIVAIQLIPALTLLFVMLKSLFVKSGSTSRI